MTDEYEAELRDNSFIVLDEDTFVRAVWYAGTEHFDVLGWMYRPAGKPWKIGYRFRHYRDDRVHGSDDEKTSYVVTPSNPEPTEAELQEIARALDVAINAVGSTGHSQRLDLNCLGPQASSIILMQPWAHRGPL